MLGRIATYLETGHDSGPPVLSGQREIALAHIESMLDHHGAAHGLRNARKHIGWYLQSSGRPDAVVKEWRRRLCTSENAAEVLAGLGAYYDTAQELAA
jgi:tRNA-dihydrouridine synthase